MTTTVFIGAEDIGEENRPDGLMLVGEGDGRLVVAASAAPIIQRLELDPEYPWNENVAAGVHPIAVPVRREDLSIEEIDRLDELYITQEVVSVIFATVRRNRVSVARYLKARVDQVLLDQHMCEIFMLATGRQYKVDDEWGPDEPWCHKDFLSWEG